MLIFIYIYAVRRCAIGRGVTAGWLGERLDSDNRLRWRVVGDHVDRGRGHHLDRLHNQDPS